MTIHPVAQSASQYYATSANPSVLAVGKWALPVSFLIGLWRSIDALAPRYSPALRLQQFVEYDKTRLPPDQVRKIEHVRERIEVLRKKMGIPSPVTLMINESDLNIAQAYSGIPGISSPVIATGIHELLFFTRTPERKEMLDGILCHELAHIKNLDIFKVGLWRMTTFIAEVSIFGLACLTGLTFWQYIFLRMCVVMIPSFASAVLLARRVEKQADLDAAQTLGTAKPLINFFKLMQKQDAPFDLFHPPLEERIRYLEQLTIPRPV